MAVYYIQEIDFDGTAGPIKIGSGCVTRRKRGIQTGNPRELKILKVAQGGEPEERHVHKTFSHLRIRGEWFKPAKELLDFIQSNASDFQLGAALTRSSRPKRVAASDQQIAKVTMPGNEVLENLQREAANRQILAGARGIEGGRGRRKRPDTSEVAPRKRVPAVRELLGGMVGISGHYVDRVLKAWRLAPDRMTLILENRSEVSLSELLADLENQAAREVVIKRRAQREPLARTRRPQRGS